MAFNGVVKAAQPDEPSYGLFSVAKVRNHGSRDEDWISGFFVETNVCGADTDNYPICNSTEQTPSEVHDGGDGATFFHVVSFGITHKYECENSVGYNAVDRRKIVVDGLERVTEFAVEHELWSGEVAELDGNPVPG